MNEQLRSHVRDHFTTVQLTLLSIIVALVLENLLGTFWDREPSRGFNLATALWWAQTALILLSALSTWSGFALGLSVASRRVNFVDLLAPFALLIALNLAIGVMHPGDVSAFLLAIGSASLIAGLMLLSDVRTIDDGNELGSRSAMRLQLGLAAWGYLGAVLIWLGVLGPFGGCIVIVLAGIGQSIGLAGTIRGWRSVT